MFILVASRLIATPIDIALLTLLVVLVNTLIKVNSPPIAATPFPISSQFIQLNSSIALDNISIAVAINTNPVALLLIFPVRSVFEINNDNSVINAPIPTSPLLNPPQSIDAIFFKAFAKIPIDILIAIIKEHAFIVLEILPCISEILFKACTNSTNKTVNATNELVNASAFIVDSVKIAPAKIPIATAILIRVPAFNCS